MFEASSELTSIMEFGFYMKYQTIFLEGVLVRVVIHTIYVDVNYQDKLSDTTKIMVTWP